MQLLATIAIDVLLAITLLISVQIAAGWGELGGIRPGDNKSGLGGFAALFALFGFRWIVLAACLLAAPPTGERGWPLVAHVALGIWSAHLFTRSLHRAQQNRQVGPVATLLGSTLIPAPAWTVAVHAANTGWLGDSAASFVAVGIAIVLLHAVPHEQRRRSMA